MGISKHGNKGLVSQKEGRGDFLAIRESDLSQNSALDS